MKELTAEERAVYQWQMTVPGVGETGQRKLKNASVLVSRCGGLGSPTAYELAAAGIGKLILAHGGNVKPSDLNRQLLMTHDWLGKPRIESVVRRLKAFNPRLEIVCIDQNINKDNVVDLVAQADLVVDAAPLFEERYLLNREAIRQNKPMVEAAMFELEAHLTSIKPGETACLACLFPEKPAAWKRQFPVFGAVSGSLGCMAAMEAIKILTGIGTPLYNKLLSYDLRNMQFIKQSIYPKPDCPVCGSGQQP